MNLKQKVRLLKTFDLLSDFDEKSLVSIAKYFQYKTLPGQTTIFLENSIGNDIYFIISGLVRIYHLHESGKEMTIAIRLSGEIIGEMSLIENQPRSASAETIKETTVFVLSKVNFLSLLKDYPILGLSFLKILSRRLREDLHSQEMLSFQTLKDRTLRVLKTVSSNASNSDISLTHEQLSTLINATQPRVTEALHSLENSHVISISRKNIHIN